MFSETTLNRIKSAKYIAILTGAGISAESGVPTFRGEAGLWKKFRPEELANFNAFMKNPQLVWEWYNFRRKLILEVKPNAGHYALAELEKMKPQFALITQNVDNLHHLAGSERVYELHGNIMRSRCVDCNKIITELRLKFETEIPCCSCGGMLRPDVVWYGEMLPEREISLALQAAQDCDVFLTVGTSAMVQPAASLPIEAQRNGAYVVELNYEPTIISDYVDDSIIGKAGTILPLLIQQLKA